MKNTRQPNPWTRTLTFLGALGLAAGGQYFLAQQDKPWTLLPGLILYVLALFFLFRGLKGRPEPSSLPALTLRMEGLALAILFALALFFRLYRLNEFPAGIFLDEGCEGWGALKILREGWRPFYEVTRLLVWNQSIYYFFALWFKLVPPSQLSLFGGSVFLGLAAFPCLYWAFRQLTNPPTALASLFLIAIMRWHWTYSRNAHPAIEILLYLSATLALWLYAHRTRKTWAFLLDGLVCGLGLYSYQAYKPFLLVMALYALYEWFRSPARGNLAGPYALFSLGALFISTPIWWGWIRYWNMDTREKQLMAFPQVYQAGGIRGVLEQGMGTFMAFNRTGDSWYIHNIPYHRLLDDGTGVLFLLGLGLALLRFRERWSFYALAGFAVMCLPALLSTSPTHASRLFGTIPFIALMGAEAFILLFRLPWGGFHRPLAWGWRAALWIFLGFCAFQNFWAYFGVQARNNDCWRAEDGAAVCWVGNSIRQFGEGLSYLICPRFYGNYTLDFLTFDNKDKQPMRLPQSLDLAALPKDKGVCLALGEGQSGILKLFQTLYPGGDTRIFRDLNGSPIAYLYLLTPQQVAQGPGPRLLPPGQGLRGEFQDLTKTGAVETLTEIDPVLNFTFRLDFPLAQVQSLRAQWKGRLAAPRAGTYDFVILTSDKGTLDLDGKRRISEGQVESGSLFLGKGLHPIQAGFQKTGGTDAAFTLLWKKPGDEKFEVIPENALRH
jgi:hypothetical protein